MMVGGLLDSYFHTIIDPIKYDVKRFSKILNYYWACYFTIIYDILKYFNKKNKYDRYFKGDKLNYKNVLKDIKV